ncbi:GNAT family N-acetyltransferase [Streptomyces sp. I05A-00742]|uniref:GNAT family N-acetyltransferase n=1 Tax=Streptomyces sp. I05A-00742 TaxID=2732853 RepID=UPI001489D94F|nr:GNAT family N-acetyltransferase [Streptomyces sp. I05A-00742]
MIPELVSTWATGWAASRATPPPAEQPWGCSIDVGLPDQSTRHVVFDPDASSVRAAALSATVPHTWLKVPADPDEVRRWLPGGWVVDEEDTGHLMAVDLRPSDGPVVAPPGYAVSVTDVDGVTVVRVSGPAGEPAAKGQMAVVGEMTVVDRVVTEEAHRRRGLGSVVMRTLTDRAADAGVVLGVLGATDEGRALYESMGWKLHAPLTACAYRP